MGEALGTCALAVTGLGQEVNALAFALMAHCSWPVATGQLPSLPLLVVLCLVASGGSCRQC